MSAGEPGAGADGPGAPTPGVSRPSLVGVLVTRQTGRDVRVGIEELLAGRREPVVTILDFRGVSIIDFSCADEVVAKLASSALAPDNGVGERFFLCTGLSEHHLDPVESALRRRDLALAAERTDGSPCVLGRLEEEAQRAWRRVCRDGGSRPEPLARELEVATAVARDLLERLHRRRLLLRRGRDYLSLRRAVAEAVPEEGTG